MFAHGAQKMPGWFACQGFTGTITFFTKHMGVPALLAVLANAAEFFGGLGLVVGLPGRQAAFGILCNMVVAILVKGSGPLHSTACCAPPGELGGRGRDPGSPIAQSCREPTGARGGVPLSFNRASGYSGQRHDLGRPA